MKTLFEPVGGTGAEAQKTYLDRLMDVLNRNNITMFLQKRGVRKIVNLGFEKKGDKYRIDLLRNQKKLEFINFMTMSSVHKIQNALNNILYNNNNSSNYQFILAIMVLYTLLKKQSIQRGCCT